MDVDAEADVAAAAAVKRQMRRRRVRGGWRVVAIPSSQDLSPNPHLISKVLFSSLLLLPSLYSFDCATLYTYSTGGFKFIHTFVCFIELHLRILG